MARITTRMTTSDSATSDPTVRARRRRSVNKHKRSAVRYAIPPHIVRAVPFVMTALAAVYAGHGLMAVRADTIYYGDLSDGLRPAEVRYVMGPPTAVSGAGDNQTWSFRRGETTHIVRFANGLTASLTCQDSAQSSVACPPKFGVTLGTHEDLIWARLGAPTSQIYRGDAKTLVYSDLGVRYDLSQLLVKGIEHRPEPGAQSYLLRVPRILLP